MFYKIKNMLCIEWKCQNYFIKKIKKIEKSKGKSQTIKIIIKEGFSSAHSLFLNMYI